MIIFSRTGSPQSKKFQNPENMPNQSIISQKIYFLTQIFPKWEMLKKRDFGGGGKKIGDGRDPNFNSAAIPRDHTEGKEAKARRRSQTRSTSHWRHFQSRKSRISKAPRPELLRSAPQMPKIRDESADSTGKGSGEAMNNHATELEQKRRRAQKRIDRNPEREPITYRHES